LKKEIHTRRAYGLGFCATLFLLQVVLLSASTPVPDAARPGYDAIQAKNLAALLKFIASDELEGRNTGSRGLNIAAKFLETQYTLAGLTPVPGHDSMLQTFYVMESKIKETSKIFAKTRANGQTDEHEFELYHDFAILSLHAGSISEEWPVVFGGFGFKDTATGYDDYNHLDAAGKVLLVLDSSPKLSTSPDLDPAVLRRKLRALRREKAKWAQEAGASALIHINIQMTPESMARLKPYLSRPRQRLADDPEAIPQAIVTAQVGNALLSGRGWTADSLLTTLAQNHAPVHLTLPGLSVRFDLESVATKKQTQNVVAYLAGDDPQLRDEVIVFGAHYDHIGMNADGEIYNGADDDGSGTVAILEIAHAFARNKFRPNRSLVFVSHAGEEKGLLGSQFYTQSPLAPIESTVALLNIDMIGRNDPGAVYIIGSNFLSKELHEINEEANELVGLKLDYAYNDLNDPNRFYYRSDHYNYAKHGVPVIFYFSGTHEDYHKPTDTIEKIDFAKMEKVTKLVYLTGWKLANLQHRLKKDGLLLEKETKH